MTQHTPPEQDRPGIPDDDLTRRLVVADPDDDRLPHIGLVGDSYTVLISGADTAGAYCLIDMLVPPGGGPGPHRHDFEEMFSVLSGEVQFTFRGETTTVPAGSSVNIPADAPHFFRNASAEPVHMLCMCTPAGQEDFFAAVGERLPSRSTPVPQPTGDALTEQLRRFAELAPQYRTELVTP